ncbi:ABC transporter permease [Cryobacterium sp. TMS1-13-1]|uniref:ABC transporter permease n=1 Tax=Cryobacterium sp. TMS1-13-1 TaxID=1259220 RepID=UPI00106D254B|nr:ABC transporter permease [Cryobacterium sp. TMS1-13-1]TFD19193.1 FtsX-like permease family protein [Cryobacterium sp. TMS1-13-1]
MIRIALRDVIHFRREAVGVVSLITVGIALFVVALSFVGSIGQNADRLLFGTIGATWVVQPATTSDVIPYNSSSSQRFLKTSGAESLRARLEMTATISNPKAGTDRPASASVALVGTDLSEETELADNFGVPSQGIESGTIDLHTQVARQLGVTEGDEVLVQVGPESLTYRIAHVFTPEYPSFLLDSWAIVDRSELAQAVYSDDARVNTLLVDAAETDRSRAAIQDAVDEIDGKAKLSLWADTSWSSLMLAPQIWGILLVVISSFTFAVICIGLTSLVYAAMLARVRDFAVIKTAGARSGFLRRMYLAEVIVQYVVGYIAGAIVATLVVTVVNAANISSSNSAFSFAVGSTALALVPTWWAFLAPLVVGFVLTIGVLWFPIRSVSSQPVLELLELR